MKQYQLYARLPGSGWQYCDTYTDPKVAWQAMLLARAKGCVARIITAKQAVTGIDDTVLHAR